MTVLMKKTDKITIEKIKQVFQNRKPGALGRKHIFSVLVPLVEIDGEINILYEVRADSLKRQPGQICFPGGELEPGETFEECAVRETTEELNVPTDSVRVISRLDTIHSYENFSMYCFLGQINYEAVRDMKFSSDEVKEVFMVPLSFLMNTEPYVYDVEIKPEIRDDFPYEMIKFSNGYNWKRGKSTVPIYTYNDKIIWGLTGRITRNLVDIMKKEIVEP